MVTHNDIRAICHKLPGAVEGQDRFGFSVLVKDRYKGFVWTWAERVDPKKAKVINDGVLVVMVRNLTEKEIILGSDPGGTVYFTEPHYNGYSAVLVRLENADPAELEDLIVESWRCKAPKELITEFDAR